MPGTVLNPGQIAGHTADQGLGLMELSIPLGKTDNEQIDIKNSNQ